MADGRIPFLPCGSAAPGFLIEAIEFIHRGVMRPVAEPGAEPDFVAIVPVLDLWRLSSAMCAHHGLEHFSQWLAPAVLDRVRGGTARLLFDYTNEGPGLYRPLFEELCRWLAEQRIPPRQVAFVSQNRALAAHHRAAFGDCPMMFLSADFFILKTYHSALRLAGRSGAPAAEAAAYPYLCLNYTPRPHRIALLLGLMQCGALDRGLVSFKGFEAEKYDFDEAATQQVADLLHGVPGAIDRLPELRARGRMIADEFAGDGHSLVLELNHELHARGHAVLVSESEFTDGEVRRVTEKSLKPAVAGRPFLIFGNPRSLALLKELGFQSFHPIIDESYDEIDNPALRLQQIVEAVARLAQMEREALLRLGRETREVCDFNRRFLFSGGAIARYWSICIEPILYWMRSGPR